MTTTSIETKPVTLTTTFAILHDARRELRTAVESGLELAEKLGASALRFAHKLVSRVDDASGEVLTKAEKALASGVKQARARSQAA